LQRENYNHPSSEGTFLIPTLNQRQFIGGFRLKQDPTDVVAATLGTDGANPAAGDALARANGLPWSAGRCQNSLVINVSAVAVCKRVGQQAQSGIVRGNSYLCPCP